MLVSSCVDTSSDIIALQIQTSEQSRHEQWLNMTMPSGNIERYPKFRLKRAFSRIKFRSFIFRPSPVHFASHIPPLFLSTFTVK